MNRNQSNPACQSNPKPFRKRFFFANSANAYQRSLTGEYANLLLVITSPLLLLWFAYSASTGQSELIALVATSVLLASLMTFRGYPAVRSIVLIAMTANLFALVINPNVSFGEPEKATTIVPTYVLLACLLTASFFESKAWLQSCPRSTLIKLLAWGTLTIPAGLYIVVIPLFESVWTMLEGDETKLALQDPNWNLLNEITYRAAKFGIFSVFVYLGACVGSFLNVVAYCVPKGEGIGLRDSRCPKCNTKLSRIDNLPIFSYINLKAKCRSCQEPISIRYLVVELIAATIFGSLFLYELVTGGTNVPLLGGFHEGILWVILYPKWPVISAYFLHAFFMCAVLVLALFEWDHQPLKWTFSIFVGLIFFLATAAYLPIQPVPLTDHLPGVSLTLSPWVGQFLKVVVGCLAGAAIGRLLAIAVAAAKPSLLTYSFFLTGMVLGWQALLQVTILFGILLLMVRGSTKLTRLLEGRPVSVLLVAIALHHPFWKIIADAWRFD
ncbi:MAG: prepilin peptidase [Mariniblastus sp.]|nr:prepilin peptidase [Mariniblastus sp.]